MRTENHRDLSDEKVEKTMRPIDRAVVFLNFDGVMHPGGVPAIDESFRLVENPDLFVWRAILGRLLAPWLRPRTPDSSHVSLPRG